MTGPTHPIKSDESIKGKTVSYQLLRSYIEFERMPVKITAPDINITGFLNYKRYKTKDSWTEIPMQRDGELLIAYIPGEQAAAKVEYTVRLHLEDKDLLLNKGRSIVTRFKGKVPDYFIIPHIFLMFISILFALRTGMEALRKDGNYFWMVNWTLGLVFVGGMILGPIVQKYAFGDLWTGFPYGFDLTDNKTLVAFIFWIIAFILKKRSKFWVLAATITMIIVYLIPHSVLGSELDYSTGTMKNKYSYSLTQDNYFS
jgi:hypothetical protein